MIKIGESFTPRSEKMEQAYPMVAKTFQGLEEVLSEELINLGAKNVQTGRRMVSFEGDLEIMYKANLCCRTALRILKPIEKFTAHNPEQLYDIVREIDWSKYMTPKNTFAIDTTVNSGDFPHSQFVTYRVKDAIVDHFRDLEGERPSISVANPDLMLNVHIDDCRVTISLDSSGEPLSKRGYRDESTPAPINEALAAGIIMMTGWRGDCDFADPMCGSGTFLIEAALIAGNINPGIYRKGFAFEKWPDFDADLFEELYNDDSAERDFAYKIYGGDIDPEAVRTARHNIKSAQVEDMIELECKPLADWTDNSAEGVMVMNPPYGKRLKPEDIEALYKGIGKTLKSEFAGWHAWIIGLNTEDFDNIGLKPSQKIPLLNGSLECTLREYVMFDGSYDNFRAGGGRVKGFDDRDQNERGPRKMKRLSDDEWKKETKRFGSHDHKPSKSFKKDDGERKPYRNDGERKPYRNDGERKPYRNDGERKPYRNDGERKPYRNDGERKPYRNDGERKPYRNDGERKPYRNDGERKPFKNDRNPKFREFEDRKPRIDASKTVVINPVYYRKRKQKPEEE